MSLAWVLEQPLATPVVSVDLSPRARSVTPVSVYPSNIFALISLSSANAVRRRRRGRPAPGAGFHYVIPVLPC